MEIEVNHPSSVPLVFPFDLGAAVRPPATDGLPPPLSFVLSKLKKKFCNTSCCVCPAGGLADPPIVGDVGALPVVDAAPTAVNPGGRPLGAPVALPVLRAVSAVAPIPPGPPIPISISVKARSTFGIVKLLLPRGPTIPAAALVRSAGFRNAPRGSLSGFFAFSS